MNTVWKVLIGLALVVPMGAYVVGSLAASAADDPAPRHTITIREPEPSTTHSPSASPTRTAEPGDDDGDHVEVITPHYDDLDDHGEHSEPGDDHGGDDGGDRSGSGSGQGGGGSDDGGHSGHGGGGDD